MRDDGGESDYQLGCLGTIVVMVLSLGVAAVALYYPSGSKVTILVVGQAIIVQLAGVWRLFRMRWPTRSL